MSGTSIVFEHNADDLTAELVGMIDAISDTHALLDEIGGELVSSTQERFATGTAPDGSSWEVSAAAIARGGDTLVDQADLVRSITHEASETSVAIGTDNDVYAAIHQFGGETGRNHAVELPARPYLGFSDEDQETILQIFKDFISDAAGKLA